MWLWSNPHIAASGMIFRGRSFSSRSPAAGRFGSWEGGYFMACQRLGRYSVVITQCPSLFSLAREIAGGLETKPARGALGSVRQRLPGVGVRPGMSILSDDEWARLKAALDAARSGTGHPFPDERRTVEAVIWRQRNGGQVARSSVRAGAVVESRAAPHPLVAPGGVGACLRGAARGRAPRSRRDLPRRRLDPHPSEGRQRNVWPAPSASGFCDLI